MARKRGYNWRPDDDAKDVPYHVAAEAKKYAKKGLIRAGLKKSSDPTPPNPQTCRYCGDLFPSKNALVRHRLPCQQERQAAIQARNNRLALMMEQGIDPMRPELGKAPKGSFLATQLQAAAARYRQKNRATVSRSPVKNE